MEEFEEFVMNCYKGLWKVVKFNVVVVIEEDDRFDLEREVLFVCCRRYVICEEMERYILNDVGISFRGYCELFVIWCFFFEMYLL